MAPVVRITEAGSIALQAAVYLAAQEGRACSSGALATTLRVSEAHLVKVLQRLARAGVLQAARGPRGGYRLASRPAAITLRAVLEAIEGRLTMAQCLFAQRVCRGRACILGGLIGAVNQRIYAYLARTTLEHGARVVGERAQRKEKGRRHVTTGG